MSHARGAGGSLSSRIVLAVLAGTLGAALLAAGIQGALLWEESRDAALLRFAQIERSYLPSLADGLWVIDSARVDVLLDGIAHLPDVGAVSLVDDGGNHYRRGTALGDSGLARRGFPLIIEDAGERFDVGRLEVELHDSRLWEQLLTKLKVMAVTTLIALSAAALFSLFLLRRWVTGPLETLAAATDALDPEQIDPAPWPALANRRVAGELRRLIDAFARMRGRLADALARRDASERELEAYRGHLEQLVAERTAELERQNVELDAYAHTVAHDLKHPLTTLRGAGVLLRDARDRMPADQLGRLVDSIVRNAQLMERIVDALLLLARARSDADVPREPFSPSEVIGAACSRLSELAESRGSQIAISPAVGSAIGHAPWVEEALVNYLTNALRYGGEPPRIAIGSDVAADGSLRFWVRDRGPGVAEDQQDKLFDAFGRPDLRRLDSHGLGLSIVKRVIERQGGQVGYRRRTEGGSEFWFSLPAA
jgi:signal transduction histidine kinase